MSSLPAAWLVPLLVGAGLGLYLRRRRRVAAALADPALLRRLLGEDLARAPIARVVLVLLAALALGGALAEGHTARPGADAGAGGAVALVLDVSNSVLARDVEPDRLAVERRVARSVVDAAGDAPVGVVVFAGRAFALSPPTRDEGALQLYLDALHPEMVTQTGSALAAALRQGVGMLVAGEDRRGGTVVLVTDGDTDDPAGDLEEVARLAGRVGVRIHAVGIGTQAGAPVPDLDFRTGRAVGFKRAPDGGVAVSRLRPEVLTRIAEIGGGEYVELSAPRDLERIAALVRTGAGTGGAPPARPTRDAWLAGIALVLLLTEGAVAAFRRGPP